MQSSSERTSREHTPDGVPELEPDECDSSSSDSLSVETIQQYDVLALHNEDGSALAQGAAVHRPRTLSDHNLTLHEITAANATADAEAPLSRWLSDGSDALQYRLSHGGEQPPRKAAMQMWLSNREDYLQYKLSYGG